MPFKQLVAAAIATLAVASPVAHSQDKAGAYPTRPIKLTIGFPPGGSTDAPVRVLAEGASKILGQPIVVENKPGAGGTMPAVNLQAAANDGYTLGVSSLGIYRLPFTTDIKWDPVNDLTYVIGLTGYAFGIVVPASSPIQSMADYIAAAKARPAELTYGTPGVATTNHLTMERLSKLTGMRLNHVPFKGSAESLQALVAGQIDSGAETSAWAPFVKDGRLRLIVTWGSKRMANFPEVPTLKELGIDLVQTSPWGIIAPKGTDPAIVAKLHDAFKQAMESPQFKQVLARYEMEPQYLGSKDFRQQAIDTMKQEKEILDALGLGRK